MARYQTYNDYLRSPLFCAARDMEMRSSGGRCRRCGASATEVHHRQKPDGSKGYPPWGCWETSENLEAICHECHCKEHGKPD
jgi:hypothetical protein